MQRIYLAECQCHHEGAMKLTLYDVIDIDPSHKFA